MSEDGEETRHYTTREGVGRMGWDEEERDKGGGSCLNTTREGTGWGRKEVAWQKADRNLIGPNAADGPV